MTDTLRDTLARPLGSLRLSVTDRCNLRCRYCMPEDEYVWLPRTSILTFEELDRVVRVFSRLGVRKVRLTGGEPLLRHDLPALVGLIARVPQIDDLALTTNGLLLAKQAAALRAAGPPRARPPPASRAAGHSWSRPGRRSAERGRSDRPGPGGRAAAAARRR